MQLELTSSNHIGPTRDDGKRNHFET